MEEKNTRQTKEKCNFCNKFIRFDNKIGVCRNHRLLSLIFRQQNRDNYHNNIEENRRKNREYAKKFRKKKQIYDKNYRKLNGKKIDTRIKKWRKERKKYDSLFKLKFLLQSRINHIYCALKYKKKNRTMELVGCDLQTLKEYIEKQFKEGMTWENHGFYGWHIDHIIPLGTAKTEEEMIKLCHYTNLQPLWALENL